MRTSIPRVSSHQGRGFSLIDVMIAVLVLAVGMLALASLQGSLVRGSAETRSRTQAAAIAEGVLGAVRGRSDADPTWYDTLTTANWSTKLADAGISSPVAGTYGETFMVTADVQRMVPSRNVATCGAGNIPCFVDATNLAVGGTRSIGEFKRVIASVAWTDAGGETHSIQLADVVSSLPSSNSAQLVNRDLNPATRRLGGPRVRIPEPDEAGVIPIAIGDGRDTAATNPKPVLTTSFGTQDTAFDVLTYATVDGAAEVQRRIETQAVSCRCRFGAPTGVDTADTFFTVKVRPTTWNGVRYATPKTAESEGITVPDAWGSESESQSPLCNDCCRDHHDPSGLGEKPKFSPYRSSHGHYRLVDGAFREVTSIMTPAPAYYEACRFIRVDGIWRVASDTRLEHMSLIQTKDFARSFIPDDTGTPSPVSRYENFVKEFLDDRVIPVATGGTPAVATLELENVLNAPATILLQPTTTDRRFLHDRALYLDYLEPSTRNYLASRLVNCTSTPQILCLLGYLPFVSINTTEIASWVVEDRDLNTPGVQAGITVSNVGGTFGAANGEPRRGKVQVQAGAVVNQQDWVAVSMDRGNAGLSSSVTVHPDELTDRLQDRQNFRFDDAAFTDRDNDGTPDGVDNCPLLANDQADRDLDGQGDACDIDDDGDGVVDTNDNCPLVPNPDQLDTDFTTGADPDRNGIRGDGIGDACDGDADMDDDTVLDGDDNCPFEANPDQADNNGNGIGNVCDRDTDSDGVQDNRDNCPLVPNPDQVDTDGDGKGDECDTVSNTLINFGVNVTLDGVDLSVVSPKPLIGWTVGTAPTTCSGTFTPVATDTNPNPYACNNAIGPSLDLLVNQYNRIIDVALSGGARPSNPCGNGRLSLVKYCLNYRLNSLRVNGNPVLPFAPAVVNEGRVGEVSSVNIPNIPTGATVDVGFELQERKDLLGLGTPAGYSCDVNGNVVFNVSSCN